MLTLMDSRRDSLQQAFRGAENDAPPLVGLTDSGTYTAAGWPDDVGLSYFVPKISRIFGLSLESSVDLLLIGSTVAGLALGLLGCWLLLRHWLARSHHQHLNT